MPNFTDALETAVRSATCGILAVNDNIQGWWARNTQLPFTQTLADGASAARRALCDNPNPVPTNPSTVGNQGQCADTRYRFNYRLRRFDSDGNLENEITGDPVVFGPIRDGTSLGLNLAFTGWTVPSPPNAFSEIFIGYDPQAGDTATKEVLGIDVVSGPDNCGTTAPDAPAVPYRPITIPIDVTYIDNSNTQITEQGDFNLALPIFLPGSVVIPFTVDFGGVSIDGRIDFNGDITFEINPGRQPDDTVTDTEPPELPPGQEPVEPETERRIIGVHVFTTLPPNTPVTTIFQEDGPNIFAPRGGSVRFLVTGGGGSSWTRDIDIKGDRQYIPCPAQQGAISVVANELPGGTVSLIRVYGSIPEYLIPGN